MKNLPPIIIRKNVGPENVNTYVLACSHTRKGVIIDPGGEDGRIIQAINNNRMNPCYILNTHGHHDHVHSNITLSRHYKIPVLMHSEDRSFFKALAHPAPAPAHEIARDLNLNTPIKVGRLKIHIYHTPGHTPGSVCFHVGDNLFTGDTLFVGAAGRTDLPGGSLTTLIHSIEKKILVLAPHTKIYPGHDHGETPFSTIEQEMKDNIYITDFILPES